MITGDQILTAVGAAVFEAQGRRYPRPYLGMSGLGKPCLRQIFFDWRWAKPEVFKPRVLRLFDRGNLEEPRFVDFLRQAHIPFTEINPKTGKQFSFVKHHGHVKGHCDGIAWLCKQDVVTEMKTHNNKNFTLLARSKSVYISKFEHYAQLQLYMDEWGAHYGLYGAVNKDTDALYFEIVERDEHTLATLNDKTVELLSTTKIPNGIADAEGFYICNYCQYQDICFNGEETRRTCRLCQSVEPGTGGTWICKRERMRNPLRLNDQLDGCKKFKCLERN